MARRYRLFLLPIAALAFAAGASAFPAGLVDNPPFATAEGPKPADKTPPGRLELRGMFSMGGVKQFAIFDTTTQKAYWLGINETEGNVRITSFDSSANAVMAEVDGQSQRLVMKEAQIVALAAAPVPPPVAGNPVPGAPAIASGAPPVDEDLQARRNRIIEELRRRRALRMSGQPPPPTVPVQQ